MGARVMLSFSDRIEIATGFKAGWGPRRIGRSIGRSASVVSRELTRYRLADGTYMPVTADARAQRSRERPKQ